MSDKHFYITTTLPYVNAEPHIGFTLEIVTADVIARYQQDFLEKTVIFNTGTDEHGQKIFQKAQESGLDPQAYVDKYATKFEELKKLLDLSYTHFIRTTNPDHKKAAQEFWKLCNKNGFIYKKNYQTKYCIGCELEKTDSELENNHCPLHPSQELELRNEENYFFKFSEFEESLLELYQDNPDFVKPANKLKEITAFVKNGLKDFSISRLKEKMPWGIAVPGDDTQVMYVWFDALVNYISTLGWPDNQEVYHQYWPGTQIAGKDNLRQQAAMWQAMLLAAGLTPSKQILINGFISIDGQKMSKSLGNVISPKEMVERYGTDATRYLLMKLGPINTDMDVSWEKLDISYTADLVNGLGNLCSRVAKLCETTELENETQAPVIEQNYFDSFDQYQLNNSLELAINLITTSDQFLAENKPWTLEKKEAHQVLQQAIEKIRKIALMLTPFMPETAQTISEHFAQKSITALQPLFPRLSRN